MGFSVLLMIYDGTYSVEIMGQSLNRNEDIMIIPYLQIQYVLEFMPVCILSLCR